jgi:hypothetical protein
LYTGFGSSFSCLTSQFSGLWRQGPSTPACNTLSPARNKSNSRVGLNKGGGPPGQWSVDCSRQHKQDLGMTMPNPFGRLGTCAGWTKMRRNGGKTAVLKVKTVGSPLFPWNLRDLWNSQSVCHFPGLQDLPNSSFSYFTQELTLGPPHPTSCLILLTL